MSLDVNALRSFLVASPKPAKVVVTNTLGDQQEVLPPTGVGGVTWAGVARTIETLDPALVEVFDADNKLIRAQRFDSGPTKEAGVLPDILARDAESARLALFAQLLAGAYKFSVETAFQKMVDIFDRLDQRQERVERRLEHAESQYRKLMQEQVDDAFDEAAEVAKQAEAAKADPLAGIIQSFAGGAAQGVAAAAPSPNGKKP